MPSASLANRWYLLESEDLKFAFHNALIRRNNAACTYKKGKEGFSFIHHKCEPLVHGAEFVLVFWPAVVLLLLAVFSEKAGAGSFCFFGLRGAWNWLQRNTLNLDLNIHVFLWPAYHFLQEFFSGFRFIKLKCTEWGKNQNRMIAGINIGIKNANMEELSS